MITILICGSEPPKIQQLGPFPSEEICTNLGKLMYQTLQRTKTDQGPIFTFSSAQSA
ncbi:hypothetical protein [Mesorhizobium sp. L2C084A000]|uniref:hypothetical protein n=1 Tax=Mesorhizobium sp. L2C084A000 TaxID=1287116 RepID=UPI0003CFAD53|nr:hypothetical protein [Mesorhizobium sp. L2C084A000]ESZ30594.1 hypothetical protein X734_03955 [Mesorhizobium sp. L2C084A000]